VAEDGNMLVLELRDESTRKVFFAGIDLRVRKMVWEQKTLPEKWWLGLFDTVRDKVVLHGYKDFQNPEHLGIYVLDIRTGKLLWKNETMAALYAAEDRIMARNPANSHVYRIMNATDGKQLKEFEEQYWKEESLELVQKSSELVKNSHRYSPENNYYQKLAAFVHTLTGFISEHTIEYLEHKDKIITSFYFKKEENLVNYLLICDHEGNLKYSSPLGENLKGIAEDSFFLIGDQLIFIKNRKELIIFEL
jgi:hypothetical protein